MQTLQKPKGVEDESRKSSTCQPGSVSIRYSDMLLVEPLPPSSFVNKFPPFFVVIVGAFEDEVEFLGTENEFFEISGEIETEFLEGSLFESGTEAESEPLVKVDV